MLRDSHPPLQRRRRAPVPASPIAALAVAVIAADPTVSATHQGILIGTVVIEAVSFWLSNIYQDIWPIILGVLLLLVILFRPAGLISLIVSERERVGPPQPAA